VFYLLITDTVFIVHHLLPNSTLRWTRNWLNGKMVRANVWRTSTNPIIYKLLHPKHQKQGSIHRVQNSAKAHTSGNVTNAISSKRISMPWQHGNAKYSCNVNNKKWKQISRSGLPQKSNWLFLVLLHLMPDLKHSHKTLSITVLAIILTDKPTNKLTKHNLLHGNDDITSRCLRTVTIQMS